MNTYILKSWPDFFEPVFDGSKTFEVRFNDRGYKVGDVLHLKEYDDRKGNYTGREVKKRITYMLEGVGQGGIAPLCGVGPRFVVLSLADCA